MEIELLQKIAHSIEQKESFHIVMNNKTRFTTRFNPHIQFKKNKSYEMAVVNFETYYSFPNITHEHSKLFYSPDAGVTWFLISVPEDSNKYIKQRIKQNGHDDSSVTLSANTNTLKAVLIIKKQLLIRLSFVQQIRSARQSKRHL